MTPRPKPTVYKFSPFSLIPCVEIFGPWDERLAFRYGFTRAHAMRRAQRWVAENR